MGSHNTNLPGNFSLTNHTVWMEIGHPLVVEVHQICAGQCHLVDYQTVGSVEQLAAQ